MSCKVFLGGTCNNSTWREELIPLLKIDYFNPVVKDWEEKYQIIEDVEKSYHCNIHLYVITSRMTGVYSIAEAIESCFLPNKTTILHVIPEGFSESQLLSLKAVVDLVIKHGGIAFIDENLYRSTAYINNTFSK